jgi:hypothetical protein
MTTRAFLTISLTAATLSGVVKDSHADAPGKILFCSDVAFTKCKSSFSPGEEIYIRATFAKPVGSVFAEGFKLDSVPTSGKFIFAIGKNADDQNPIIMYPSPLMVSRYKTQNTLDLSLQADEKNIKRIADGDSSIAKIIPFNSQGTMGNSGLATLWSQKAVTFPVGSQDWEAFLFFIPSYGDADPITAASGKFSYAMAADGKAKLAGSMNSYDKQRFEKAADDGIVTGVHKANVGKIVFAGKTIPRDFDAPKELAVTLPNLSSGLFARLYLKQSVRNFFAEEGQGKDVGATDYVLHMTVAGKKRVYESKLEANEALKSTSWDLTLVPSAPLDPKYSQLSKQFVYLLSSLPAGTHTVNLSATIAMPDKEIVLAEGKVDVVISLKERDAVAKKYGQQLPVIGLLEDKALDKAVRKLMGPKHLTFRVPYKWEERKNRVGIVTHRVTTLMTGVKNADGECQSVATTLEQPKTASGFGATVRGSEPPTLGGGDLPCQNFNK